MKGNNMKKSSMYNEIMDQYDVTKGLTEGRWDEALKINDLLHDCDDIIFLGTGASLNACYSVKNAAIKYLNKIPYIIEMAEISNILPTLTKKTVCFLVSQSNRAAQKKPKKALIYYTQIVYENFYDPIGMIIISLSDVGIIDIVDTILSEENAFIFMSDKDGNIITNENIIPDSFDMDEYRVNYFETSYVTNNDHLVIKNNRSKYNYVLNVVIPMKAIDVDRKQMNLFLIVYIINFMIILLACFFTGEYTI